MIMVSCQLTLTLLLVCTTVALTKTLPRQQEIHQRSFWRPSTGEWFVYNCLHPAPHGTGIGEPGDIPVNADYTGNGMHEFAVYKPTGTWIVKDRETGKFTERKFGQPGDIPLTGDYTGDGIADFTVWRPKSGVWYFMDSVTQEISTQAFGIPGDIPVSGDFTGDGVNDLAVFQPLGGVWLIQNRMNSSEIITQPFGFAGDIPISGDFDGDGKNDFVVYRPGGLWTGMQSSNKRTWSTQQAQGGDVPLTGDFTGDGKSDMAVWRPRDGTWIITGLANTVCGTPYDIPVSFV